MKISIVILAFVLVSLRGGCTSFALHDLLANTRADDYPNTDEQFSVETLRNEDDRPKKSMVILVPLRNAEENSNSVEERTEPLEKLSIRKGNSRLKPASIIRKPRRTTLTKDPREYFSVSTSNSDEESIGNSEERQYFRIASVKNAQNLLRNLLKSRKTKRESKDRIREIVLHPRDQDSVILIGKGTKNSVDQEPKKYVCYCVEENETKESATNPTTSRTTKTKVRSDIIGNSIDRITESSLRSSALVGSERNRNSQPCLTCSQRGISMQHPASLERLRRKQTGSQRLQPRPLKMKASATSPSCVSESLTVEQPTRIHIPINDDRNLDKNSYRVESKTPYGQNGEATLQRNEPPVGAARPEFVTNLNGLQDAQSYLRNEPASYDQYKSIPIGPNIVYPAPYMILPQYSQYPQHPLYDESLTRDEQISSVQSADQSSIVGEGEPSCDSYSATPFGQNFVNIDECIRLYGRDNCIRTSTSRLSIDDVKYPGNNDEEDEESMIGSQQDGSYASTKIPERKPTKWKYTTNPNDMEDATNYDETLGVTRYYQENAESSQQSEEFSQASSEQTPITTPRYFADESEQPLVGVKFGTSTISSEELVGSKLNDIQADDVDDYQNYDDPKTSLSDSSEITNYSEGPEESEINEIPKKVTAKISLEFPRFSTPGTLENLQAAHGISSSGYLEITEKPDEEDIEDITERINEDAPSSDLGLKHIKEQEVTTNHEDLTSPLSVEYSFDDDRAEKTSNNYDEASLGNRYYTTQSAINIITDDNQEITTKDDSEQLVMGSHNSFPDEISTTTSKSHRLKMPASHSTRICSPTTTERFSRSSQNSPNGFNLGRESGEIDATEDSTDDCITDQSILGETMATEMTFVPDDLETTSRDESHYLSNDHKGIKETLDVENLSHDEPDDEIVSRQNNATKDYSDEMLNQPYEESMEEFDEESNSSKPIVSTIFYENSSIYPNVLRSENKNVDQTSSWTPENGERTSEEAMIVGNSAEIGDDCDENLSSKDIPEPAVLGMKESSTKENLITSDKNPSDTIDQLQRDYGYDILGDSPVKNDLKNLEENNSQDDDDDVSSTEEENYEKITEDDLSPEDERFLRTAVKKVVNHLVSANVNSLKDKADKPEVVGVTEQEPLSGINNLSILKSLFTLPEVREMAINDVKNFINKMSDSVELGRLSDETIGSVFDHVISDTLPGPNASSSSSIIVNEHQYRNGQWVTEPTNLASTNGIVGQKHEDEISSSIENIIGQPGIGLEGARLPSVQNIIVKTVENALKNTKQTVDHSAILDALRNIISRAEISSVYSPDELSYDGHASGAQGVKQSYESIKNLPIIPVTERVFKDGHWSEKQTIVGNTREYFEPITSSVTTSRTNGKLPPSTLKYETSNIQATQYGSTPRAMDYTFLGDSGSDEDDKLTINYHDTEDTVGVSISTITRTPVTYKSETNQDDIQNIPTKYYSPNGRMMEYIKNLRKPGGGKLTTEVAMKVAMQSPTTQVTTENYVTSVGMGSREFSTTSEASVEYSRAPELGIMKNSGENVSEKLTTDYPAISRSYTNQEDGPKNVGKYRSKNLRKPGGGKSRSEVAMKVALQSPTTDNCATSLGMGSREFSTTSEASVEYSRTSELGIMQNSGENVGEKLTTDYRSTEDAVGVTESLSSSTSKTPALSRSYTNQEDGPKNAGKYRSKNLRKPGGEKSRSEVAMKVALQSPTTENCATSLGMGSREFSTTSEASVEYSRASELGITQNSGDNVGETLITEDAVGMTESLSSSTSKTPALSRSYTNQEDGPKNAGKYRSKNLRKPGGGKSRSEVAMKVALQSPTTEVTTENYATSVGMGSREFSTTSEASVEYSRASELGITQNSGENMGETLITEDAVGVTESLSSSTSKTPALSRSYTNQEDGPKNAGKYRSKSLRKPGGGKSRSEVAMKVALQSPTTDNESLSIGMGSREFSTTSEASVEYSRAPELGITHNSAENIGEILTTDYQSTEDAVGVTENLPNSMIKTAAISRTDNEDGHKIPTKYNSLNSKIKVGLQSPKTDVTTENYSSSIKMTSRKFSPVTEPSVGLPQAPQSYSETATAFSPNSNRGSTKKSKTQTCANKNMKNNLENVGSSRNNSRKKLTSPSPVNNESNYSKPPNTVSYSDFQVVAENMQSTTENYVGEENSPETAEIQSNFDEVGRKTSGFSSTIYPSNVNIENENYTTEEYVGEENPATTETTEENGDTVEITQSPMSQSTASDIYRNEEEKLLTSANFEENEEEEIDNELMELSATQHSYGNDNNHYTTEEYVEKEYVTSTKNPEESNDEVGMPESSIIEGKVYHLSQDNDDGVTQLSSAEENDDEDSNYSSTDKFEGNFKKVIQDSPSGEILETGNDGNVDEYVTPENDEGSINRHEESTTETIKKFTKASKYPYSVAEIITRNSVGAARSRGDDTKLLELPSERVGVSRNENGNNNEVALSTDDRTNYANPSYDPTYFGRITLNSLNPDNDKITDLTDTDLFYVGDGVKIPLKLSRMGDGSWALSISEKICENYVKRKCPCCVSNDGHIVEERKRTSDDEYENNNFEKSTRVKSLDSAFQGESKKRYARSTSNSEIFSTTKTPVEKFAIKYNLSLDPTDCPDESTKSWRRMKSKPTMVMRNKRRNNPAESSRDGQLLKLFQNNNQIQRDDSSENMDRIIENKDKNEIYKKSNALVRTELTFDTNSDELMENLMRIKDVPERERAQMVVNALDNLINSAPTQNIDPMLESYSVVKSAEENPMEDRLGINDDVDLIEMANEMAKYGYQKDNPILEKMRFIKKKQKEHGPYKYQRNINHQVSGRMNVLKTVLEWLKQVFLESEANNET